MNKQNDGPTFATAKPLSLPVKPAQEVFVIGDQRMTLEQIEIMKMEFKLQNEVDEWRKRRRPDRYSR
jgi:hypothetical protein